MMQLQVLPRELALQSISRQEIVLPLDAAIAAIDYCANRQIQILGIAARGSGRRRDGRETVLVSMQSDPGSIPPRIEWLDDSLPDLAILRSKRKEFDFAMLSAVWMHLDETERHRAMPIVSALLRDGAMLVMSLRHGMVPKGRRMFDVSAEETIQLASAYRLRTVLNVETESIQHGNRRMGVTWTQLAFVKDGT